MKSPRLATVSTAISIAAIALAAVTGYLLAWRGRGLPPAAGPGIHVVDGDTVDYDGRRWRLTGYDTPEIYHVGCSAERHRGIVAAARLVALIEAGARLEPEPGRDKYGRGLGRLMLGERDVAGILIQEGHARPYDGRSRRDGWCG